jgi:drug/metabolite transporter (DMT)-like permease
MDQTRSGLGNGLAGVLIFSASLPATRAAVIGLDPVFLTLARATIAGLLALLLLGVMRRQLPGQLPVRADIVPLGIVALGVVVGFPLLTALALRHIDSAHAIVFTGLLPLATAGFAVLRGGERPDRRFWLFAILGGLCVAGFALASARSSGASLAPSATDLLMLAAILVCGLGYAEGAVLARRLGGWQVICWALVLALPVMLAALPFATFPVWRTVGAPAWAGLASVSLFSMLIGFIFWYRGLALGGTAAVGQLQLLQPLFGLALAALLLGEPVGAGMVLVTLAVIACVAGARHFAKPAQRSAPDTPHSLTPERHRS